MATKSAFIDGGIINSDVQQAEQVILGLNYDVTSSGLKGADKGPKAILDALNYQIEPYNLYLNCEPCGKIKIACHECGNLNKMNPEKMFGFGKAICATFLRRGQRLAIVGGEHSVTIPALAAYSELNNVENITILHIDAHLDLRDTDEFRVKPYGKYAHCCVMRRAWDFGFRNFVQVGARSYSKEEREFAEKNDFRVFWSQSQMPEPKEILDAIKTKDVWVSLDVDGICPGDMPATGTPVGGGPELDYVRELLWCVRCTKIIAGADVVEVAPDLGTTNLTAYNAAQLLYDLICYMSS